MTKDELACKERQKYAYLWRHLPEYREISPAELFVNHFLDFFEKAFEKEQTLIDFGTGCGRVAKTFLAKDLRVKLVDFCPECLDQEIYLMTLFLQEKVEFIEATLWDLPDSLKPCDWIYCCDVLEHIPESRLDLTLSAMAARMKKGGYLSICLKEDEHGRQLVGEPLHLIVKDSSFWRKTIQKYWTIEHEISVFDDLYFNCCISAK
jgi:2-polyprenyl-3-methyl-5-hydroxy-6-metoxy-1,4-benzoquinol methylase